MPAPALHILCAELGLIAYAPGFLTDPVATVGRLLPALPGRNLDQLIMGKDPAVGSVPFGFITEGSDDFIVTIRGTQMPDGSLIEWLDDFDAVLEPCPWDSGSRWHRGFGRVYSTLTIAGVKLGEWLAAMKITAAKPVKVHGHSLGGPLATYAADQGGLDAPVLFASPKPGDGAYRARLRNRWLPSLGVNRTSYANPNDAVPKVPITAEWPFKVFDFEHVFDLCELSAGSVLPPVGSSWADSHNLANYLRLLEAAP